MSAPPAVAPSTRPAAAPPTRAATVAPVRPPPPVAGVDETLRWALGALGDTHHLHPAVRNGLLEAALRAGLDHVPALAGPTDRGSPVPDPATSATVRTVCAYLAAGSYEDAYLALLDVR